MKTKRYPEIEQYRNRERFYEINGRSNQSRRITQPETYKNCLNQQKILRFLISEIESHFYKKDSKKDT